jgi:hypothetical protein
MNMPVIYQSYWQSPEAIKLFEEVGEDKEEADSTGLEEQITKRIEKLQGAYSLTTGWKSVLDDSDEDTCCSPCNVFQIQYRCRYICRALRNALEEMPKKTWEECCKDAVETINRIDIVGNISGARTIMDWSNLPNE